MKVVKGQTRPFNNYGVENEEFIKNILTDTFLPSNVLNVPLGTVSATVNDHFAFVANGLGRKVYVS